MRAIQYRAELRAEFPRHDVLLDVMAGFRPDRAKMAGVQIAALKAALAEDKLPLRFDRLLERLPTEVYAVLARDEDHVFGYVALPEFNAAVFSADFSGWVIALPDMVFRLTEVIVSHALSVLKVAEPNVLPVAAEESAESVLPHLLRTLGKFVHLGIVGEQLRLAETKKKVAREIAVQTEKV